MGLPSGNLWRNGLVGSSSPQTDGLFYQWGDIVGHDLAEGYQFNLANYEAKELNNIQSDLDNAHDAARAYYGPIAKMPSTADFQELIDNCVLSFHDGIVMFTSQINGASISLHLSGTIVDTTQWGEGTSLRAWSSNIEDSTNAFSLVLNTSGRLEIEPALRTNGCAIMAIHS